MIPIIKIISLLIAIIIGLFLFCATLAMAIMFVKSVIDMDLEEFERPILEFIGYTIAIMAISAVVTYAWMR